MKMEALPSTSAVMLRMIEILATLLIKTAGVMGVEQQSPHSRTDNTETLRESGHLAMTNK